MNRVWVAARSLLPHVSDYRATRKTWRGDLVAGVTVGIVALPLALGFGVSSGVSAEAGLITAIVAGVIAAVFGGSNVQVSGPTGAMVVVLVPVVAAHGVAAIAIVSVLAGAIVLAAGTLRLGRVVSFIPWPVIEGFTLGIAVIIFLQQVPLITSPHRVAAGEHSSNAIVAAAQSFAGADWAYVPWSLAAVAVVAAVMVFAPRVHPAMPASLIGIAIVSVIAIAVSSPLATIGVLPTALPVPSLPPLDGATVASLVPAALTVGALAAIESLLSARVAASIADTGPYDPDRELVGQGLASIGSGLFGGMPATGAIARTAVNIRSGGRTRLASIVHAALLLVIVLVAAVPVGHIPLAALAGVLMMTAVRMVHIAVVHSIIRSTKTDALAFIATAVVTVSVDLIVAVIIGVTVAGIFAIRALARTTSIHREELPEPASAGDEEIALLRIDGPLFFAAVDRVYDTVTQLNGVSVIIVRMSQVELIDASGAHVLAEIVTALERRGVTVLIKGIRPAHHDLVRTLGVLRSLRHHNHLFNDLGPAIEHARSHVARHRAPADEATG